MNIPRNGFNYVRASTVPDNRLRYEVVWHGAVVASYLTKKEADQHIAMLRAQPQKAGAA